MAEAPAHLPEDQRARWQRGCSTWTFPIELGGYGVITVWPDGRSAVSWGDGESFWGRWDGESLELDEGGSVDAEGWPIEDPPEIVDAGELEAFVVGVRADGHNVVEARNGGLSTGEGPGGSPAPTRTRH